MSLQTLHLQNGAQMASDGIPLHYGDMAAEYKAALAHGVLLDRSHEGRLTITGSDRLVFLDRMSTNALSNLQPNEGRPTLFTNANARILDRVVVYERADDLLVITEPGRSPDFQQFLQKNIFFRDQVKLQSITATTRQFDIHGPHADSVLAALGVDTEAVAAYGGVTFNIEDATVYAARRKHIVGQHWMVIPALEDAENVYSALQKTGESWGIIPAGSLVYNVLRIRSGRPAGRELSTDYIPLEVGLWDEVSFNKGCYTGQEIIARMESRGRLAKTIVRLKPDSFVEAPVDIFYEGRPIGRLTSSVQAPDGMLFALGVFKTAFARSETVVQLGENQVTGRVLDLAGKQPEVVSLEDPQT